MTFELNLLDDVNTDEVIRLMEDLQSDLKDFDEMLLDAAIYEVDNK